MTDRYKTIQTFQYSSEAYVIKGLLESHGIQTFLLDNLTIDADPLVSNAVGGVKLQVFLKDEEKAIALLKSIHKYSLTDDGQRVCCKNCGSENVDYVSTVKDLKSLLSFLLGFFFFILPFYTKYTYRCESCKKEFNL